MPYRYLENIAIADIAFEAWGETVEEMFIAASDAVINTMVADLCAIEARISRRFQVEEGSIEVLLFQMLQELIYYKDAEQLLLRARSVRITPRGDGWVALIETAGEPIAPERHELIVDVKAVTLYQFRVEHTAKGWRAAVVVDV